MSSAASPQRVVLIGSSLFTARCLNQLLALTSLTVVGVVTNPQQFSISYAPSGVDNIRHANMGALADNHGIPAYVMQTSMHEPALAEALTEWQPNVILVAGWYHMVPKAIRAIAPCLGLHASLLPKYSGGAPLVWSLIENATETGITLFIMDSGVDSGPIIGQKSTAIHHQDTIKTLYDRVEELGLELLSDCLPLFLNGDLVPRPQNESERTLYPQRKPSDGWLDLTLLTDTEVYNRVRAQTAPYPGAFTRLNNQWAHLWSVSIVSTQQLLPYPELAPGEVTFFSNGTCWARCKVGAIQLDTVSWLDSSPFPLSSNT
ncbi:MAG: methionyl-tRNA formyltransferase [Vampirovibrionales bacterium]|nr:methionyl-tRNA formyltransferase [Vampirovibrionales bacterium]